jgi:hypothetical protein
MRVVTDAGAELAIGFSSGYDVLEGMLRHCSPLASISFLDREELSRVEDIRNFG